MNKPKFIKVLAAFQEGPEYSEEIVSAKLAFRPEHVIAYNQEAKDNMVGIELTTGLKITISYDFNEFEKLMDEL